MKYYKVFYWIDTRAKGEEFTFRICEVAEKEIVDKAISSLEAVARSQGEKIRIASSYLYLTDAEMPPRVPLTKGERQ